MSQIIYLFSGQILPFLFLLCGSRPFNKLTTETVESASLPLQGINDIHGCDGLSASMLCVSDCISNHILQKHFQYSSGLLVDHSRDTFHAASPGETSDGWLGDTLNVIAQHFSVALGSSNSFAALAQTFASLTASSWCCCAHCVVCLDYERLTAVCRETTVVVF